MATGDKWSQPVIIEMPPFVLTGSKTSYKTKHHSLLFCQFCEAWEPSQSYCHTYMLKFLLIFEAVSWNWLFAKPHQQVLLLLLSKFAAETAAAFSLNISTKQWVFDV